jgi:hypothetical protein
MPDRDDQHNESGFLYLANHAEIADAKSPQTEFASAQWLSEIARVSNCLYRDAKASLANGSRAVQSLQFPGCSRIVLNLPGQGLSQLLARERGPPIVQTRLRQIAVFEILDIPFDQFTGAGILAPARPLRKGRQPLFGF